MSVVVAARDEEASIRACVLSLLDQRDVDVQVIVVDDGSTDGTAAVLSSIADPRLLVVTNEGQPGRSHARNLGIQAATAPIIAIQDADDIALPGRLATTASLLDDPEVVAASGQCIARTPAGRYWLHAAFPTESSEIRTRLRHGVMGICHGASAIRRSALVEVGGYDADFPRAQDLELYRRLEPLGEMRASDRPLIVYTHPVLVPWSYWSATRDAERRMRGEVTPPWVRRRARHAASNARRVVRFVRTTRAARRLANQALAESGTTQYSPGMS